MWLKPRIQLLRHPLQIPPQTPQRDHRALHRFRRPSNRQKPPPPHPLKNTPCTLVCCPMARIWTHCSVNCAPQVWSRNLKPWWLMACPKPECVWVCLTLKPPPPPLLQKPKARRKILWSFQLSRTAIESSLPNIGSLDRGRLINVVSA